MEEPQDHESGGEPDEVTPRTVGPAGGGFSRGIIDPATRRLIDEAVRWQDGLGRQLSQLAATKRMFDSIEAARRAMTPRLELPTLNVAGQLSSAITGHSLLTGTLAAQIADARILRLAGLSDAVDMVNRAQIARLSEVSKLLKTESSMLAALRPAVEIARGVVFATEAWESVTALAQVLDQGELTRLEMASRGTTGAIEAGLLLSEPDEETTERRRAEFSATRGPTQASVLLRTHLTGVHPDLLNRLDGAWERIHRGGADAASQAANSLMEVLDWTLRLLSPDDEALEWHAAERRPDGELHNGKPTRTLRIRYAVRDQPEKAKAAQLYVRSVQELVTVIQSPKHSLETKSAEALASVALTVEGLLYFLLVG